MIINDKNFDKLEWERIPLEKTNDADSVFLGCTIIGTECIDCPNVDGIILYAKDKSGKIKAIDISCDIFAEKDEDAFYLNVATV